jgi:hypothetical protein
VSGTVPLFPNMPPWRGAQFKHRDKFPLKVANILIFTFSYRGKEDSSEPSDSKYNQNLILSSLRRECKLHLLVSFPNI